MALATAGAVGAAVGAFIVIGMLLVGAMGRWP